VIGFTLPGAACRAREPVPGDCELAFYEAASRSASYSAAVPVFIEQAHDMEQFWMGLFSAPIHSLEFPVLGFRHFGPLGQGNGSSAVEGRPVVLSR